MCAVCLPVGRTAQTYSNHAHVVPHAAAAPPQIFLTALHVYAAVGFPDDHGELLLATENWQPVITHRQEPVLGDHPLPCSALRASTEARAIDRIESSGSHPSLCVDPTPAVG